MKYRKGGKRSERDAMEAEMIKENPICRKRRRRCCRREREKEQHQEFITTTAETMTWGEGRAVAGWVGLVGEALLSNSARSFETFLVNGTKVDAGTM